MNQWQGIEVMTRPSTTERFTLADAAQDVVESARYGTDCYVTVNRIDGLEACIPDARAIEAATIGLLAAIRRAEAVNYPTYGRRGMTAEERAFYAAADALETLIGVPS